MSGPLNADAIRAGAAGAGAGAGYQIDQSIRFNRDDTAKLTRTFGTATNRKIFTFSVWVKNGNNAGSIIEYNNTGGVTWANIQFGGNRIDYWDYSGGSARIDLRTTAVFRDPSAWYHLVVAMDTTQGTASNRLKFYVNGSQITSFGTSTYPSLNFEGFINSAVSHLIGKGVNGSFDGYLAEYHFIDGQALTPTDFGETNADTGQWVPVEYTGSYGSNGFYLKGEDSSDLGNDSSGNNNDFASSGLTAADQRLDSPTLNKATLNGVNLYTTGSVLSDGNLTVTNSGTSGFWRRAFATQALSYKTYWEVHADNLGSLNMGVSSLSNPNGGLNSPVLNAAAGIQNNEAFVAGSYANESSGGRTFPISTGNYVMFAFDPDRGALWAGTEGTWKDGTSSSASSATILAEIEGTGTSYALFTGIDPDDAIPHIAQYSTSVATARFSSEDWEGTAPTGYEQLAPSSLPDPTIANGSEYYHNQTYTGTGSSGLAITNTASAGDFKPDILWLAPRSNGDNHVFFDSVRGTTQRLKSNTTEAEDTDGTAQLTFETDGFDLDTTDVNFNGSSRTYVAWQWKTTGGTSSSNTDGNITSTVSANTTAGFSVLTYSGNGSDNQTIGHGLGIPPKMIWSRRRDTSGGWTSYHDAVGINQVFYLNSTSLPTSNSEQYRAVPTSSVYTVGVGGDINSSGGTYVSYVFAEVDGFSKISSYSGNGSTDGTFVYTGFKPSWIILKRITGSTQEWQIYDAARDPFNVANHKLEANSSSAESILTTDNNLDFLSNGFKLRQSNGGMNASGSEYLYMAFAESPFKTTTAR